MKHKKHTRVLIVGAGPAGMLAGILLARSGADFQIIDKASRPASRSNACVLHSRSLALLGQAGLLDAVLEAGRRIDTIKFFDGDTAIADVSLSATDGEFPFAVALSQAALEKMLDSRLSAVGNRRILWNHRLARLEPGSTGATAVIEQVGVTAEGYGVPTVELVVESEIEMHAAFVLGDDGPDSIVRAACRIHCDTFAPSGKFIVCDTAGGLEPGNEARMILGKTGVGGFWPLPGNQCRWVLPATGNGGGHEIPPKDRTPFVVQCSSEEKSDFQKSIAEWAPWFKGSIPEINWLEVLSFPTVLANQYGTGQCWILGDAAHEGGPIGMQSMNAGLADAAAFADAFAGVGVKHDPVAALQECATARRDEWLRLTTLHRIFHCRDGTHEAIKRHLKQIPWCLPALGVELDHLLRQLGIETSERTASTASAH